MVLEEVDRNTRSLLGSEDDGNQEHEDSCGDDSDKGEDYVYRIHLSVFLSGVSVQRLSVRSRASARCGPVA